MKKLSIISMMPFIIKYLMVKVCTKFGKKYKEKFILLENKKPSLFTLGVD